jgi:hypothetical protein
VAVAALVAASSIATFAQASKVDVTGKWVFAVETSAGSGTPTITLKQDGEKLTGHYSGQFGEADLTGTVKDQNVSFKFTVDAQGNMLDFVYTGTIESKDALKGRVSIVGLGEGTFTAKRQ